MSEYTILFDSDENYYLFNQFKDILEKIKFFFKKHITLNININPSLLIKKIFTYQDELLHHHFEL